MAMLEKLILDLKKFKRVDICYKSGVSIATLNSIMSGANDNPTIKTVQSLQDFIKENKGK